MKAYIFYSVTALLGITLVSAETNAAIPTQPICLANSQFHLEFKSGIAAMTSLRRVGDADAIEFLRVDGLLGEVQIDFRTEGSSWTEGKPEMLRCTHEELGEQGVGWIEEEDAYDDAKEIHASKHRLLVIKRWDLQADVLIWKLRLKNVGNRSLEVGDLALPLPMNTDYSKPAFSNAERTFRGNVFKHAFIAGNGSFLYWLPVKGTGPILVMMPQPRTGLEFFTSSFAKSQFSERYVVHIYSAAVAEIDRRGTWRQPQTSIVLKPGEEITKGFEFRWSDSYAGVRELLYQHGGLDIYIAPSMVVPDNLPAMFALRTKGVIDSVKAEFPNDTAIEYIGERGREAHVYSIKWSHLGENDIRIRYNGNQTTALEFFVTLPLEDLIKMRAAFICKKQQHRDSTKWYDGLFSLWDRRLPKSENLLGPEHLGGEDAYAVSGSDDPSNCKCLLVAEKNVAFPDAGEIEALEYYIKNFVWGKLQRTDREQPYSYGIYGADSWEQNRFSTRDPLDQGVSRPGGPSACRMWRTYDYPTCFALYFDMYRIALQRPDLVHYLDSKGYLERAYGTARAFFEVPQHIALAGGWGYEGWVYWQYTVGNFHEKYLLPLIDALEATGQRNKAGFLRREWEKKVKYFIYDNPWSFTSEMPIDSTAYESTYVAAKYALTHGLEPDHNLWFDRNLAKWFSHPNIDSNAHSAFLLRQQLANLACRGVLETNYWSLGSDFRGCGSANQTLSYMSQMGGWAILDYALRFDVNPGDNLRLGYASMLSSWALMNAGNQRSNFGFWSPGKLNNGAMSWRFEPQKVTSMIFGVPPALADLPRGACPVCGEADHGLVAGIEGACTVLFDDPIFGLFAYGGKLTQLGGTIQVIPLDGVRQRFSAIIRATRLHLALDRDGFAGNKPIELTDEFNKLTFTLENRGGGTHTTNLAIEGLKEGHYEINGRIEHANFCIHSGERTIVAIPMIAQDNLERFALNYLKTE
jgi:hypothetical protein